MAELITPQEEAKFKQLFEEKKQPREQISFNDFCSIVKSYPKFASLQKLQNYLDQFKKEIKIKMNTDSDIGITLGFADYSKYIRTLITEYHRSKNIKDDDFRKFF